MSYPRVQVMTGTYEWQRPDDEGYKLYQLTSDAGVHAGKLLEIRLRQLGPGQNDPGAVQFSRILISGRIVNTDGTTKTVGTETVEVGESQRSIARQEIDNIGRMTWLSQQITDMITMLINLDTDAIDWGFIPVAD